MRVYGQHVPGSQLARSALSPSNQVPFINSLGDLAIVLCVQAFLHIRKTSVVFFFSLSLFHLFFIAFICCVSQTLNLCQNDFEAAYFTANNHVPSEQQTDQKAAARCSDYTATQHRAWLCLGEDSKELLCVGYCQHCPKGSECLHSLLCPQGMGHVDVSTKADLHTGYQQVSGCVMWGLQGFCRTSLMSRPWLPCSTPKHCVQTVFKKVCIELATDTY